MLLLHLITKKEKTYWINVCIILEANLYFRPELNIQNKLISELEKWRLAVYSDGYYRWSHFCSFHYMSRDFIGLLESNWKNNFLHACNVHTLFMQSLLLLIGFFIHLWAHHNIFCLIVLWNNLAWGNHNRNLVLRLPLCKAYIAPLDFGYAAHTFFFLAKALWAHNSITRKPNIHYLPWLSFFIVKTTRSIIENSWKVKV